ncbi:hypothetical protein HW130_09810 [Streptomyces sp. PKU-EA00015]|uniref:hypothetical protein n=1 Tax=Streptomyces sp. PKU-EA00015 TaxID=2748326 RepID=UPI0015A44F6E|nr:hypothetical protein [Streptomyces sp. PKU-EA00015]NWF26565.1 hypothetical protein [Streptomyces sp. PKU-EA00015]
MTRTTALNTGLDDFLAWAARERGTALPARPADAVLTLLALRGADRRSGVPEPTPQLVAQVLHEDLPGLLWASDEELAAVPAVLTALADRVRAAGRLNAKRHARLLAAIDDAVPGFRAAMADPAALTWPRWYASLLRADGTDPDDADAVRAWLDAHERTPRADRPALPEPLHRFEIAGRTFATRARLAEALLGAFARDTAGTSPAGPLLPAPPLDADRPDDALGAELERIADALTSRWTAAGLTEALAGPHAGLAPSPEALPHAALADRMLDEHLDYYGASSVPLPPPARVPAPGDIRALLHAAPLPAALAAGGDLDDERREISERCGLPGPATPVWDEGTPQELVELAADILAAQVEMLPTVSGPQDNWSLDGAHILYSLYERGSTPDSVARKASDTDVAEIPPELEDAPTQVPAIAPAAYETPSPEELSVLLGLPGRTEADRDAIDATARPLAALVDRLAETGCVFRRGDTFGLTPLGGAVVRHVMAAGQVAAPDAGTVAGWDAAHTVAAVRNWPPRIAARTLAAWADRRADADKESGAAWVPLLTAVSEAKAADRQGTRVRECFALLDRAGIPNAALRAVLTDPVTGAEARRLLLARGEDVPGESVPPSARATLLAEELDARWTDDMRAHVAERQENGGARVPGPDEIPPTTLLPSFDEEAAVWPGGAPALIRALAAEDPGTAHRVLTALRDHHPDKRVSDAAAHALKPAHRAAGRGRR